MVMVWYVCDVVRFWFGMVVVWTVYRFEKKIQKIKKEQCSSRLQLVGHLKIEVSQCQKLLTNNFSKIVLPCHQFKCPQK